MPRSTPKLCPTCRTITPQPCPTCSNGWTSRTPTSWAGGSTRQWRKTRARKLALNPLCEWPGCYDLATTVDHIDGTNYHTQRYDMNQLRSLCQPHHATRTANQGNAAKG